MESRHSILEKFIFSLGIIAVGLIIGQSIRVISDRTGKTSVKKYIPIVQKITLLGLNPIITIGVFWIVKIDNVKLVAIPILGFTALVLGGILGLLFSKMLLHDRKQTGSMFVCGSFTNMGTFGGLICFAFFGEISFAFVSMYKLFEEFAYYLIGYPIAKFYGSTENDNRTRKSALNILLDPFVFVYLISILLGLMLNFLGIDRPLEYKGINETLIPLTSILLVTTVGFNMRIKAIRGYLKESFAIASIKFIIMPIIITSIAYFIGIGSMNDGLVLKVILVLSAMPPAFNSLIPPQIYNLDVDLANSVWLFGTGCLVAVVPILFVVQSFI
jgi:predicted permease